MKTISLVVLIFLQTIAGFAQNLDMSYAGWVGFETSNKEISLCLPKDYLVNVENLQSGEKKSIYSFANGVTMEFSYSRINDAKSNLARVHVDSSKNPLVLDFVVDKVSGRQIVYGGGEYRHILFLAASDNYYRFEVSAVSKDQKEVALF